MLLAGDDLTTRTKEDEGAPELRALAGSFNLMADRLEHLLRQQRGFASDASHQLRTPLTGLRLRLENATDAIDSNPEGARVMVADSLEETYRLQRIIDGLLLLSRAENREVSLSGVDLSAVARNRLEQWEALAEETGVSITLDAIPEGNILAMPGAAEQIIDNLIDNALAVAPPGSQSGLWFHSLRTTTGWSFTSSTRGRASLPKTASGPSTVFGAARGARTGAAWGWPSFNSSPRPAEPLPP